jgi:outer membrane protein assembly factor BamA
MANAAIAAVRFHQQWKQTSAAVHDVNAAFTVRAGTGALESDLEYERYLAQADYSVRWATHRLVVSGMFGGLTGDAPLFERFSLGDSRTLRGWDKYRIAPAGGDRMFHTSVEYRRHALALFLDAGSVWDRGADRRVRFSTGFGFAPGPLFLTVAFPLNTGEFRTVFTMGLRFSTASMGILKN